MAARVTQWFSSRGERTRTRRVHRLRRRADLAAQLLEDRRLLAITTALVSDINQSGLSSDPTSLIAVGNNLFFTAADQTTGQELYRTDTTSGQTDLVADLFPGDGGSAIEQLTAVGSELYFVADDDGSEPDLWKSDGTTAGTVKVFDADAAGIYSIEDLTASGGKLFFTAGDDTNGYELWVSDGTSSGTAMVVNLNQDEDVAIPPEELTDVNGTLFFAAYSDGYDNKELFKTDGTAAGTVLVKDLDNDPYESGDPRDLAASGGLLYFQANAGDGFELFRSDGTASGTFQVADLNPGGDGSDPRAFTEFAGETVFIADDGSGGGDRLYSTDGNTVTALPSPVNPGDPFEPEELTVVGNQLFFSAIGGSVPGVASADRPVLTPDNSYRNNSGDFAGLSNSVTSARAGRITIATSTTNSYTFTSQDNGDVNGDGNDGPGWVGASAQIGDAGVGLQSVQPGDLILKDVDLNGPVSDPFYEWVIEDPGGLTNIEFSGFASGNEFDEADEGLVFELFLNGATTRSAVTTLAGDDLDNFFASRNADNISLSHPGGVAVTSATLRMSFGVADTVNNKTPNAWTEQLVIRAMLTADGATSGGAGRELHVYDGTNVTLVKDIVDGASSGPSNLTAAGGQLFFVATNPLDGTGTELYKSDGTEAGTMVVRDIRPGANTVGAPLSSEPIELTAVGNTVYFSAITPGGDRELYSSDGTSVGTDLVAEINAATDSADPQQFVVSGQTVYFVANDGINGEVIYQYTDTGGVVPLLDVSAEASDEIIGLTVSNTGDLYFGHNTLGTFRLSPGGSPVSLTSSVPLSMNDDDEVFRFIGTTAFFSAPHPTNGIELWRSNGTAASTQVATDLLAGVLSSGPRDLTVYNNQLYFSADSNVGREVYAIGTSGGPSLVANIDTSITNGRPDNSNPREFVVSGGVLYLSADDPGTNGNPRTGRELYAVTPSSVTVLETLDGGGNEVGDGDPKELTDIDGVLYFAAFGNSVGNEPFTSTGTASNTNLVTDLAGPEIANPSNNLSSFPAQFTKAGSVVYFAANTETTGRELFRTDGTAAGTELVADLAPGNLDSNPEILGTLPDGRILFSAVSGPNIDRELYIAGGTIDGIRLANDIYEGPAPSDPSDLVIVGDTILVVASDGTSGRELRELIEIAPTVAQVIVDDGRDSRSQISSVTVEFDSVVDIDPSAFELLNQTTGETVALTASIIDDAISTVTLTFGAGAAVDAFGRLIDGEYQLTIDNLGVSSLGTLLDGDGNGTAGDDFLFGDNAQDDFFRKFGDANGDREVLLPDFGQFRSEFGLEAVDAGFTGDFDANGDGINDLIDFGAFRSAFGT